MAETTSRGASRAALILSLLAAFALGLVAARLLPRPAASADAPAAGGTSELWTCGMHPQVIQDHPGTCPICHMELTPLAADGEGGAHGITIDPVVVQNMGVRTEKVASEALRRDVRAAGYLEEPEPAHRDVNLRVSGWIEELHASVDGMSVEAGDPLFELYSPELSVAIEELIAAGRSRASRDPITARTSEAAFQGAARKLEALGIASEDVERFATLERAPRTVTFRSPMRGHVTEKSVYPGAAVEAGTRVLRLADRSTMWLDAQVFERDLAWVQVGAAVRARVETFPGRVFEGRVTFVHPHLDPMTRSALVRAEVPNGDHALRQGMYASVVIEGAPAEPRPVVAREAVIDTGARRLAFVSLGEGRFEPRELELGLSGEGGRVQVLSGLSPGEEVVVSGQFLLDAESRIREAIAKHLGHGLVAARPEPAAPAAPAERAAAAEAPQRSLDRAFEAFLALGATLGAVRDGTTSVDRTDLERALAELAEVATGPTRELAERAASAAKRLSGGIGDDQRAPLQELSDAVIALADRSPPSRDVAAELFVMHCPMAPGSWLQSDQEVRNPYYTRAMKACGEVVRTIATAEKSP